MATLQSGKCFTVPTFFGMCCRSEWQERMYIYKWHEVDQTKHEIFCVHIVCNEIQVKVNLEITTFYFYLRFPYCPNFFWFGVVHVLLDAELCISRSNPNDHSLSACFGTVHLPLTSMRYQSNVMSAGLFRGYPGNVKFSCTFLRKWPCQTAHHTLLPGPLWE